MLAKLLVKKDHPINLKLKNITLMNMVMDLDSIKGIMKCHLMITGRIKTLYYKKKIVKLMLWLKIQLKHKKIGLNYQTAKE